MDLDDSDNDPFASEELLHLEALVQKMSKINKLTSVFHASVLLLIMNFVITLSK